MRSTAAARELREFLEDRGQAYVLRVASSFVITLAAWDQDDLRGRGEEAAEGQDRRWEVRSAGKGSKGERWYAWAWIATASPRHSLLVRRHLKTGELAFHYCFVPDGQRASKTRLIRAAGLRWPVEESFEFGKGCFGLDQCQARLYTAILRHLVLVMAALAICAVTAAQLQDRTDAQAPPPARPDDPPPARPRPDPAHRPRGQAPARRRPQPPRAARPRRPLAPLATPPPGTIPLVPPTRTPNAQLRPGQLAIGGCRTRAQNPGRGKGDGPCSAPPSRCGTPVTAEANIGRLARTRKQARVRPETPGATPQRWE